MLELRRVRSLDVDQGRILVHDTGLNESAKIGQVLRLALAIEPAAAEGERVEFLVDVGQELLGAGGAEGHVAGVGVLHEVRALHIFIHKATTSRA